MLERRERRRDGVRSRNSLSSAAPLALCALPCRWWWCRAGGDWLRRGAMSSADTGGGCGTLKEPEGALADDRCEGLSDMFVKPAAGS